MCPHCGQNAPLVYRGVAAYCAACGGFRVPLTGSALALAGQPSRVGGVVARVFGWVVLGVGFTIASIVGLVSHALFPLGLAWLIATAPIVILSLVIGLVLLRGGRSLDQSGARAERKARADAVFALATHKGGTLTAPDVAAALDLRTPAAEELLESLAKEEYERIGVDVDASGTLVYRFVVPNGVSRVRVDPEVARSPNRAEWERLEAEESAAATAAEGRDPSRSRPQRRM
jgi:hypothetical protein